RVISWLRAWCLARQLLVVDEVHASDPYMSEIITRLVSEHLTHGGYALLMSATLGETLRAKIERRQRVPVAAAVARQYPAVSTQRRQFDIQVNEVRTTRIIIEVKNRAFSHAVTAVGRDEAVLWIRSTIADALNDYHAFQSARTSVMLHHSRYADVDRQYLDRKVLRMLGPGGQRAGIVIVGTQTLEQSLDIDADLLITDAVPADVLLQRLGRLHRHRTGTAPTAVVLDPGHWDHRVQLNGQPLGGPDHGWAWIYNPLAVRETIEWLRIRRTISVPADVREIVELATHADHLRNRAQFYGGRWVALWRYIFRNATTDAQQAFAGVIDRQLGYEQALVTERGPTRLGDGSVDVEVRGDLRSPFTQASIEALSIRANWLREAQPGSVADVVGVDNLGRTLLDVNGVRLAYGVEGLVLN